MFWNNIFLRSRGPHQILRGQVRTFLTSNLLKKSHYDTLGIKSDATQAEIKNAYFELSKIYHPDRIAATDENLAKFREITDAYGVLGNEHSRKLYDKGLLGKTKKLGIDDAEEVNSHIIEFYKQRQQAIFKPEQTADEWTQTQYKSARTSALKKNDLYQSTVKAAYDPETDRTYFDALFVSLTLASMFLWWHLEDSSFKQKINQIHNFIVTKFFS